MPAKRSSQLRPLSDEHHQALLVAFQLKKGLAGHADSAGAPRDLAGLISLARRYEEALLVTHTRTEEDLLGRHLDERDRKRIDVFEHGELRRLAAVAKSGRDSEARTALAAFADLLERHIRWEERELFPRLEEAVAEADLILSTHYRSPIEVSDEQLRETEISLDRYYSTVLRINDLSGENDLKRSSLNAEKSLEEREEHLREKFEEAMDDDFNTALAIGHIFEFIRDVNKFLDSKPSGQKAGELFQKAKELLSEVGRVLNIFGRAPGEWYLALMTTKKIYLSEKEILEKIEERQEARLRKEWDAADRIRKELDEKGIILEDKALVAQVLEEMGVREQTIGVASVGCSVFAYNYFNTDFAEAAHGRAPAMPTGIKRLNPGSIVFTYQGDGDLASIGMGEIGACRCPR